MENIELFESFSKGPKKTLTPMERAEMVWTLLTPQERYDLLLNANWTGDVEYMIDFILTVKERWEDKTESEKRELAEKDIPRIFPKVSKMKKWIKKYGSKYK